MSTTVRRLDDWQDHAACAGDEGQLFYPPLQGERKKSKIMRERRAKNLCAHCSVQGQCLDYALANDERYGIWGGLTDTERRGLVDTMVS